MLAEGNPIIETTFSSVSQFGCSTINQVISIAINSLASIVPGLSALTSIILKFVGFLPNSICNNLSVIIPSLLPLLKVLLKKKFYSAKRILFCQSVVLLVPKGDEWMQTTASYFTSITDIINFINKNASM